MKIPFGTAITSGGIDVASDALANIGKASVLAAGATMLMKIVVMPIINKVAAETTKLVNQQLKTMSQPRPTNHHQSDPKPVVDPMA